MTIGRRRSAQGHPLNLSSRPAPALASADPAPDAPHTDHPPHTMYGRLSVGGRVATFLGVTLPVIGLVAAAVLLWDRGFHWADLGLLLAMYAATVVGVGVGYHRLFVHRSFETFLPIQVAFAALGSMALQGTMIHWAALHRWHHRHSDDEEDVHSPHHGGTGVRGVLRGFWHSHIGWAFYADPPGLDRYVKDLRGNRALRVASALFPLWAALGLIIPAVVGGLIAGTWAGAVSGLLWGGLVRILLVHHVTWSINSVCHLWGRKTYDSGDESRDNAVLGVLAFGEGWHNTHHAFPTSARHGLRWWQLDVGYWVIRSLEAVGLAWNVKVPTAAAIARRAG